MKAKAKPKAAVPEARSLVDCQVNDIVDTPVGLLIVCGRVDGRAILVRRWDPEAKREAGPLYGEPEDLLVLKVTRKLPAPPVAGGEDDPLKGR